MKAKLVLAMFMTLFFSISVYAAPKPDKPKKQTIGGLECATGEVAKMQADETWACAADTDTTLDQAGVEALGFVTGDHTVDTNTQLDQSGIEALVGPHTVDTDTDTSAATECGPGELYLADGTGGGVCLPLAPLIGGPMDPAASACPCNFLEAVSPAYSWFEGPITCTAQPTSPAGQLLGEYRIDAPTGTENGIIVRQDITPTLPVYCNQQDDSGWTVNRGVADGLELNDCFEDLQTVAIALGVSCPEPPVFIPQP